MTDVALSADSGRRLEWGLRAVAIVVALLAVFDPGCTRMAAIRPVVAILQGSPADHVRAQAAAQALAADFDVVRGDVAGAAAYVLAGDSRPDGWTPDPDAVVFSIVPDTSTAVRILRVRVPDTVAVDSVAPVDVDVEVPGDEVRALTVSLVVEGTRLQHVQREVVAPAADGTARRVVTVPMTFVPTAAGVMRLRIEAGTSEEPGAVADVALTVTTRVWKVLAFDGRPTYLGTFVRRALEEDPRFDVTARSLTSRQTSVQTGAAPDALSDARAIGTYDLVVVGAPDALGATEAVALDRYLRDRHGAAILLPETPTGVLLRRLTGVPDWREDRRPALVDIQSLTADAAAGGAFTASEFVWPLVWPPLARPLTAPVEPGAGVAGRPDPLWPVWQMPVGAGRLIVSAASDGWRSRGGDSSGFSTFWRSIAAGAAQATPPPVDVQVSARLVTPGEQVHVRVEDVLGDWAPAEPIAEVTAGDAADDVVATVRLWPSGTPRVWAGEFRSPFGPGRYRVHAGPGAQPFQVVTAEERQRPAADRDGLSAAAAWAHRGAAVPERELATLSSRVREATAPEEILRTSHPMRSVWWLPIFVTCTVGEWWLRRRRGAR